MSNRHISSHDNNTATSNDLVYLDYATTSRPKAPGVVDEVVRALTEICSSPDRSNHRLAREACAIRDKVRNSVSEYFKAKQSDDIIFTSGATMALNMAVKGVLKSGDHVVTTCFDHNSVLRPLARLREQGIMMSVVQSHMPENGMIDAIQRELRPTTRLVAITHASNVCGCVLPVQEIVRLAHARGIIVLLDAAQSLGHVEIDLSKLAVDLLAFSGHKGLLGPPGIGCLIVNNPEIGLKPLLDGGTGYHSDTLRPEYLLPNSYEPGTQNLPAIAGLGAALNYALSKEFAEGAQRSAGLARILLNRLGEMPHIQVYGARITKDSVPIVSFNVNGIPPQLVAAALDEEHAILVRAGLHCSPLAHKALGTFPQGTVRVSFGHGNTNESLDRLCEALGAMYNYK